MEHLPNKVEPKRSEGVPKETPERNSLEPIAHTLSRAFPDAKWGSLAAISRADYFAAGMQEQLRMLARSRNGRRRQCRRIARRGQGARRSG